MKRIKNWFCNKKKISTKCELCLGTGTVTEIFIDHNNNWKQKTKPCHVCK